jgi:inosine/xanthosine triphosphate pyrophosphatase family protein
MGSGAAGDVREGAGEPGPEVTCTKEIRSEQEGRIQAAAAAAAPCFTGTVAVEDGNLAVRALGVAPYNTRFAREVRARGSGSGVVRWLRRLRDSMLAVSATANLRSRCA